MIRLQQLEDLRERAGMIPRSVWSRRADTSLSTLNGGIRLAVFTTPFIVRWAAWAVALLIYALADLDRVNDRLEPFLLLGTFTQTLAVTFYVPVLRPVLLPWLRERMTIPDNADVLVLGLGDLVLSMVAVYLSGGWGSPYFHFALTALLIPSFFLDLRGVLALGGLYLSAYVFGVATFGDGIEGSWKTTSLNSFIGALVTPLLVVVVPNYLGSVLRDLDAARQDAVDALADSDLQFRVGRSFLESGRNLDAALPAVATALVDASRFDAAAVLLRAEGGGVRAYGTDVADPPDASDVAPLFVGEEGARTVPAASVPAALGDAFAGCEWTGAVPLRSIDAVEGWLFVASKQRPSSVLHEVRLLDSIAGQIALGARNIRLSEQVGSLAAEGERSRIAREIHDGIAQMVYMLSLSLETAIDRVGSDPDEQRQRLQDLTALAKNALWEVRQYIFDLRPLLSGEAGLVGAVQGQVKEFQAVSELPVALTVTGEAVRLPVAVSAALYRIVQEGLGNIFRHARATTVEIALSFAPGAVTLAIADDGIGMGEAATGARVGYGMGNLQRRVDELRGTLDVRSEPGGGTRIEVTVPIGGDE